MIQGIPFFGESHAEIMRKAFAAKVEEHIQYDTMFQLVQTEVSKNAVIIVDNKWFTWLHDIVFNYRDGQIKLPYYTYELYDVEVSKNMTNNKGHLLLDKETNILSLRHNYDLCVLDITLETELTLYDVKNGRKYSVAASAWYDDTFELQDLYVRYLSSAYYDFDELLEKHIGGYHYITRQYKGFANVEWRKRKDFFLENYRENQLILREFRDVRQYRREQLFGNAPIQTIVPYKFRRLVFDSMLCCIIKQHSITTDTEFNERYKKLSEMDCILNYKPYYKAPSLIFKSYWYGVGTVDNKRTIKRHV